jgi:hypothetical protein
MDRTKPAIRNGPAQPARRRRAGGAICRIAVVSRARDPDGAPMPRRCRVAGVLRARNRRVAGANALYPAHGLNFITRSQEPARRLQRFRDLDPSNGDARSLRGRCGSTIRHRTKWSIYRIDLDAGLMPMPATAGGFTGKRGEFYDHESWKGRMIWVRFVWQDLGPHAHGWSSASRTMAARPGK